MDPAVRGLCSLLETKLRQPRVTVGSATEWLKELAIVLRDRHVIHARD
jgi:hypothetical protein